MTTKRFFLFRCLTGIRVPISRKATWAIGTASILLLLVLYTWLSIHQHKINSTDTTIPTWMQMGEGISKAFAAQLRTGDRWIIEDVLATFSRLGFGLGIGVFIAFALGMSMGVWRWMEAFFLPILSLFAKIPPTAMMAVFFTLFGTELKMYGAIIAFGVIPTLAQTIYLGLKDIAPERIDKARTLGASTTEIIFWIMFPQILPKLLDAIRLQIGPAMVFLIAAEVLVGDVGFGYRIRLQSRLLNMNVVYPYLAYLALFGFGMDTGMQWIQRKLCPWYVKGGA